MEKRWRKVRNLNRSGKINQRDLETSVKTYHVVPEQSRWVVKRSGASRASKTFANQVEAVEYARDAARRIGSAEVIVHGKGGRIRKKDSYGSDVYTPHE